MDSMTVSFYFSTSAAANPLSMDLKEKIQPLAKPMELLSLEDVHPVFFYFIANIF